MKLFQLLLICNALAEYEKRPQPHRQLMTDPDKIYYKPQRRQITDVESMNKVEFAIYNNRTVQQLRFKDPRKLTRDEAEDICEFYATLRKWQARMDDDEERELYQKEKAHQSAAHGRDEKKKRKQDPKKWENGEIPKKNNGGAKNEKEMDDLEMRKIREHERMRNRENLTESEEENEIRKRRETDDNEENGEEELSDDDLIYPLEFFDAQEQEEEDKDYVPPLSQEKLYNDYLKVHEITARLFQTRGDMEFDAVWEKVKNQIPWSFSKGKADSKLKDIFQRQANKVQDDEKNRMLAAAEAKRQRDQKEAIA